LVIALAEARGKDDVRDALRGETLRGVERSGRRAREARIEHHQAIARAMRLGLSTREIAAAAGVSHGTVRAISNRVVGGDADDALAI
jgi:DNA-binding NarL/FixJ family response regulator